MTNPVRTYMILSEIFYVVLFLIDLELIYSYAVKWFEVFLSNSNNSI